MFRDPDGYYAALLKGGYNLPADDWKRALSDAKNTKVHQGFKKIDATLDWQKILVSETDKPILRTVDATNLLGIRELYQLLTATAAGTTLGDPPALVMFMPFELRPELYGTERNVDIA